jgi:hypothetical protein
MTNDGERERTCRRTGVTSDGISFISCNGSRVLSLNYHHSASGTSHPKSIWLVSRLEECHLFCEAEKFGWSDLNGNYWAVSEDAEIQLGSRGERIAFFSKPQNDGEAFHGFPVGGRRGLPTIRKPPDAILDLWLETERISYTTYARLMEGRL